MDSPRAPIHHHFVECFPPSRYAVSIRTVRAHMVCGMPSSRDLQSPNIAHPSKRRTYQRSRSKLTCYRVRLVLHLPPKQGFGNSEPSCGPCSLCEGTPMTYIRPTYLSYHDIDSARCGGCLSSTSTFNFQDDRSDGLAIRVA